MTEFRSFDTADEMFAAMAASERRANESVTDQQRRLTFGDYWFRPMGAEYDFVFIFGRINTVVELIASELLGVTEFAGDAPREAALLQAQKLITDARIDDEDEYSLADAIRGAIDLEGPMTKLYHEIITPAVQSGDTGDAVVDPDRWAEFESTIATMSDGYQRGYRFGKAWSLIEPRGEYGDTHISQMCPSAEHEFRDAANAKWDFRQLSHPGSAGRRQWAMDLVIRGATLQQLHEREVS